MADLEHGLTIHELELAETISGDSFVAIDDGTNTKKAKIANLNSASATSAQTYAEAAAASAAASASSATQAQTSAQSIQSAMVQATSQLQGYVDDAAASASSAAASEANIRGLITSDYAKLARSYATGDSGYREGEETDNAKYYSEQSESYVDDAAAQAVIAGQKADLAEDHAEESEDHALESEGHALGTQNGTPVSSDSPYYHNNAKYWADEARQSSAGGVAARVIATAEPTNISSHAYAIGDQFVYNGILYKATSPISIGSTIVPGTNCMIADNLVYQIGEKQNIVLASAMTIGGQTITEVEPALHALNNKPSGSGGSKITISTNETTLHGKTVTATGTSETKTATIGNDGKAVIDGFMDTGTVTISASDGTETASVTISIPYFGNYAVSLSFWAATLSITTDSPDLYGQTITVKDSNQQTVATSVFSGQGTATATVNSTGTYTVSATSDGVTVNESVIVSAQTTYNVSLHLWTATVSISTTSSELYGQTIIVKKGGSTVGTTSFSAQGIASYSAHETGEYTFECTYSGQTYSDSVTVSAETSYSATINTDLILSAWLTAGNVTGTYADFSEVEADEKAIRKLMTIHAAVDYLATCASATDSLALSIINSDICAKWINLRDYALDTLYANTYLAAMMDTADKYFYGEWVITDNTTTPPTWGAKGNVPIMTGNTAPYGTVRRSSIYNNNSSREGYKAFSNEADDGTNNTMWVSNPGDYTNEWIEYQFTNPICVKKVLLSCLVGATQEFAKDGQYKIQWSDDGTNYTDVDTVNYVKSEGKGEKVINNDEYHLIWRVKTVVNNYANTEYPNGYTQFTKIQFYGRTLKVSVPVMTSNTAPYGEVSASSYETNNEPYKAVNGNSADNHWASPLNVTVADTWWEYKFTQKVSVREIAIRGARSGSSATVGRDCTYTIYGSNDGTTFSEVGSLTVSASDVKTLKYGSLNNDNGYVYYRIKFGGYNISNENRCLLGEVQFYALDYSEYDWDTNHPRKYLYDHGVEVETLVSKTDGNANYEKRSDELYAAVNGQASSAANFYINMDLSTFNLIRIVTGEQLYNNCGLESSNNAGHLIVTSVVPNPAPTTEAALVFWKGTLELPFTMSLDISALMNSHYVSTGTGNNSGNAVKKSTVTEWWLE